MTTAPAPRTIDLLNHDEAVDMIDGATIGSRTDAQRLQGKRNAALVAVLFGSGLRLSEALNLRLSDWERGGSKLHVRNGKGGKSRRSKLLNGFALVLDEWITERESLNLPDAAPLFCTLRAGQRRAAGRPLVQPQVAKMLQRMAADAGITGKRVHPHGFRHSHAAYLVERGASLFQIQRQLGHSSAAVTDSYLRHIGADLLLEGLESL